MGIHTIQFDRDVNYTDQSGVSFVNETTDETVDTGITAVGSGTPIIIYTVPWLVEPVAGDDVTYNYDASAGNYVDDVGQNMPSQEFDMVNCLGDLPPVVPPVIPGWLTEDGNWNTENGNWILQ